MANYFLRKGTNEVFILYEDSHAASEAHHLASRFCCDQVSISQLFIGRIEMHTGYKFSGELYQPICALIRHLFGDAGKDPANG